MFYKLVSDFLTETNGPNKEKWERIIKRESLSCNRCNGLSAPVFGSVNKYECINCKRRFTNSKHFISKKLDIQVNKRTEEHYQDVISTMS